MKIIKKVIVGIITIILMLLMAFNVYSFYSVKVLKQDLPSINGYAILEVVSGSMEPTIHVGDLIVINTKETNYSKNDIVTFKDVDGSFVTHRIKFIDDVEMTTRGDNNNSDDAAMPVNSLVGKYLFKINGLGRLLASFKNPFVMVMIFVIGLLTCIFISTDKEGNPILDENEKEFLEFQKRKKQQQKQNKEMNQEIKKEDQKNIYDSAINKEIKAEKIVNKNDHDHYNRDRKTQYTSKDMTRSNQKRKSKKKNYNKDKQYQKQQGNNKTYSNTSKNIQHKNQTEIRNGSNYQSGNRNKKKKNRKR